MDLLTHINKKASKSWNWFVQRAHGKYAQFWLSFLSFSESSFFIVSPDLLLIAILMAGASRWVYFAALTTAASVVGGIFGYVIAAFFYDTIGEKVVTFYGLSEEILSVGALFDRNTFWIIFLAAFTPIPYKIFVLAGGFFKVNFIFFLIASTLGRGLRYFIVAYVVKVYGERIVHLLLRYFAIFTFLIFAVAFMYLFFHYDFITLVLG